MRRTRLNTRRDHVSVSDRPPFVPSVLFAFAHALTAEGALLHHAARSNRHFGIVRAVERRVPLRVVEVEKPGGVRTIVRTIARADAPVVDLRVETFVGVIGCVDRANGFAGRFLAMLTEHRSKLRLY